MRGTDPEFRAMLESKNLWRPYIRYREDLKRQGVKPGIAKKAALAEVDKWLADGVEGAVPTKTEQKNICGKPKPGGEIVKRKANIVLPQWANVKVGEFEGKNVSDGAAVSWAVSNVVFEDISPDDAPSATAWLYLLWFRQDPDFLKEVLKKRVPSITKVEGDIGFNDDQRKQFNIIEMLQREESVLSSGQEAE